MTLLHTKGYSEVLESVKMRAQKKAAAMARMQVSVKTGTILESLRQIANTIVLLAAGDVEGTRVGASYSNFTEQEDEELRLIAAEDVLPPLPLRTGPDQKVAAEEKAEVEA